jgi:hypothetical protein
MFTYSDNTNYNRNFYYFIVPIFNWDIIYSAMIHVSDIVMEFSRAEYSALFRQNIRILR